MRRLISFAVLAAAATSAHSAPVNLTPAAQKDIHCFMIFAIATNQAAQSKDEQTQQAASLEMTYYLGKLQVSAPGADLSAAIRQEAGAFKDEATAKSIGEACNAEFTKAGAQLAALAKGSDKPETAPPPKK